MSLKAKSSESMNALIHLADMCEEWGFNDEIASALKNAKKAIELEAKKDLKKCVEELEDFEASSINKRTMSMVKEALNELKHS